MSPENQLHCIWTPHEWVYSKIPVLPIAAVVHDTTASEVQRMPGLRLLATTRAAVTICVTGAEVYAGVTEEISGVCRLEKRMHNGRVVRNEYVLPDEGWEALQPWKRPGLESIIRYFNNIARNGADGFDFYEDISRDNQDATQMLMPVLERIEAAAAVRARASTTTNREGLEQNERLRQQTLIEGSDHLAEVTTNGCRRNDSHIDNHEDEAATGLSDEIAEFAS